MINIAIFASGNGSNAEHIINYFSNNKQIRVKNLLSNNPNAYALKRAEQHELNTFVFNRKEFYESEKVLDYLIEEKVDFIVLAGFLWLVPKILIRHYQDSIVNIHPALLPKYGGKGMYGSKVHEAVVAAQESETGITIHFVNDKYDEGDILFQARCSLTPDDTPTTVQQKVHQLEYRHFPVIIEKIIQDKIKNS